jgi:hypothetical protein
MKKGILTALVLYCIGFGLTGMSYIIFGYQYGHGPGLHHLIIVLTLLVGFFWVVGAARKYFFGERTGKLQGIILVHVVMILGFVFYMVYVTQ